MKTKAFTLIELLIVIAIIAILALIAIPNFLESQVRAKVSRTKADMRMIASALEAYQTDYGLYPLCVTEFNDMVLLNAPGWPITPKPDDMYCLSKLTTPVAYITTMPQPPFAEKGIIASATIEGAKRPTYSYDALHKAPGQPWGVEPHMPNGGQGKIFMKGYQWLLWSVGPTRSRLYPEDGSVANFYMILAGTDPLYVYDPSNGTMSFGFVIRTNKGEYTGTDYK